MPYIGAANMYIRNSKSPNLSTQMETVKKFISLDWTQDNLNVRQIFIRSFPGYLHEEFREMSKGRNNPEFHQEIRILFFETFKFIFRNKSLLNDGMSQSFVVFFLDLIKTVDPDLIFDPKALINSIEICVSYEPNKALFINENGVWNMYNYFKVKENDLFVEFFRICQEVYDPDDGIISSLSMVKISDHVNRMMSKSNIREDRDCGLHITMVFMMFERLKLFYELDLDLRQLYVITEFMLMGYIDGKRPPFCLSHLSHIWTLIFRGSRNRLRINNTKKLIVFAGIHSIALFRKLKFHMRKSQKFTLTENTKQILYTLYLMLIALPYIDRNKNKWLIDLLKDLHGLFQTYFEKYSIEHLGIDGQFHILQYYIKSYVTLCIVMSLHDRQAFQEFFDKLRNTPSLKLHLCFLQSLLWCNISFLFCSTLSHINKKLEDVFNLLVDTIKELMRPAISNKLQADKALFFYEDVKSEHLSMMESYWMTTVFSKCIKRSTKEFSIISPEGLHYSFYKICYELMAGIAIKLNDSSLCHPSLPVIFQRFYRQYSDDTKDVAFIDINSDLSKTLILPNFTRLHYVKNTLLALKNEDKTYLKKAFRIFTLIYELKLIFCDIDSQFRDIHIMKALL
ncbi:hypothetical protein RF11_04235 [Thelohanellus kitauei]|uniref:Uncharacterized protein n=1 Tax=Thelohanellus kitauei TaxID=669202 RepID=A0A0C2N2G5_THEKT|nr:hypothetical protein RF11_04235 [Thelohanellus kitauei]